MLTNGKSYLHLLLVTTLTAALYPLPALLSSWGGHSYWFAGGMTVLLVGLAWLGMLVMLFLRKQYRKMPRRINGLLWVVTLALLVAGTALAPYPSAFLRFLFGLGAGGSFFAGTRLVFQPVEHLSHAYVFTGVCIWDVFTGILLYLRDIDAPILPVILLLAVNAALFALAHNLAALERMLRGRANGTWELPQEIQRSNSHLMVLLCVIGVVLLCSYRLVARFLWWLLRLIYTGVVTALQWLLSLGSHADEESAVDAPEQMLQAAPNPASPWIRWVIYGALLAGILALVIWKRREIRDGLVQIWCALRRWVLSKLDRVRQLPSEDEDGAYCDYVEDLIAQEHFVRQEKQPLTRRRWNRIYRQYLHMPPDTAKFRLGYALVLARLPEDMVTPADSTGEILEKQRQQEKADGVWECVTAEYNQVRYGENLPNASGFRALNQLLERLQK